MVYGVNVFGEMGSYPIKKCRYITQTILHFEHEKKKENSTKIFFSLIFIEMKNKNEIKEEE
jgi:hypothetical protein